MQSAVGAVGRSDTVVVGLPEMEPDREFAADLDRLTPSLLAAARYIAEGDDEAHDLVQSTLEIAFRRRSDLRDHAKLRSWLFTIQTREGLRRRRRFRRLIPLDSVAAAGLTASQPDAELAALRQALALLPQRIRAAVVLHHMVGLSVEETGSAMGVSVNTVKTELRHGLERLRASLDE